MEDGIRRMDRFSRKLDAIYAALESNNYRSAIKLCSRKDIADWLHTKALKAIALEKVGHREEAVELCREIKSSVPVDENLLSTTSITFHAVGLHSEATQMYQAAAERMPTHPDLQIELFYCFLREYDFMKQQQQASKLFKMLGQNKFLFWSAVSMLMQIRQGGNPRLLELAEKMVHKAITESLSAQEPTYEEVMLYVTILKEQAKYNEAVTNLEAWGLGSGRGLSSIEDEQSLRAGPVVKMQRHEILALKADLLNLGGNAEASRDAYAELLLEAPDQWDFCSNYLDCAFAAVMLPGEVPEELFWSSMDSIMRFISSLKENFFIQRGPYLLEMEFINRVLLLKGSSTEWPANFQKIGLVAAHLVESVQAYFERFSDKLCCFSDLTGCIEVFVAEKLGYADGILQSHRLELLNFLEDKIIASRTPESPSFSADENTETKKDGISRLRKHICALQLKIFLGANETATVESIVDEVKKIVQEYKATLHLNEGNTGGQREVQFGDELVLIAAHILMMLAAREGTPEPIAVSRRFEAMLLLQMALRNSGHNYHMKITLLLILKDLAAFSDGIKLNQELEIKQIQVDSLSWLYFPGSLSSGLFTEALKRCYTVNTFHRNTSMDIAEGIRAAYVAGNYVKAIEIIEFQKKMLEPSMQWAQCKSEEINLELLLCCQTLQNALTYLQDVVEGQRSQALPLSDEDLTKLSINQDFQAAVWYSYFDKSTMLAKKRTKMTQKIQIRQTMAKLLFFSLQGSEKWTEEFDKLQTLLELAGFAITSEKCSAELKVEEIEVELASMTAQNTDAMLSLAELKKTVWILNLRTVRFMASLHEAVSRNWSGPPTELSSLLERISSALSKLKQFCVGPRHIYLHTLQSSQVNCMLSPTWLKGVCFFMVESLSQICLVIEAAVGTLPFKKKKGKKGKKGPSTEEQEFPEAEKTKKAFKKVFDGVITLVVCLRDIMKKECDTEIEAKGEREYSSTQSAASFIWTQQEFGTSFDESWAKIHNSNSASAEKLLDILKAKLSNLQNLKLG